MVVEIGVVFVGLVVEEKHHLRTRFDREMAGQPNIARHRDFLQFEAGARLYAGDKAADVNWMDDFHFNLHPLK